MKTWEYEKSQTKYLCSLLKINTDTLNDVLSNIGAYYNEWIEEKIDKKSGLPKTYLDGTVKKRIIRPSLRELKSIQKVIQTDILAKIILPDNIHGGIKKRSNITNAKAHKGNKYQFTTDLQDFYPSINNKLVYTTFLELGYSSYVASLLTKLTTWKNELPQGTPTSTHIANLSFLKTDKKLIEFCQKRNIKYTRYVDDLTFSAQFDFSTSIHEIIAIILSSGFKMSRRKTIYKGNQTITGIDVFNNYIDAPKKVLEKYELEQLSESNSKPYTNYVNNIRKTNIQK